MENARIKPSCAITALCMVCLIGLAGIHPAEALDTDIYFSNPNSTTNTVKPNILLILDTSSSMNSTVSDTGKSRLDIMKDALYTLLDNTNNVNMGLMRFSGSPGGPVLYPIADLDALASYIEGTTVTTAQSPIVWGSDDAEEKLSDGTVTTTSTQIDLISDGSNDQRVGLRFQNVNIPRGAAVTSAVIKFRTADSTPTGATDLVLYGEASDNAATYTTATGDITGRNKTAKSVSWSSVPTWTTVDSSESTPELKEVVQEIVDRSGWCGGNAMAFTISGSGRRVATSYEGDPSAAPVLIVTYDPSSIKAGSGCITKTLQARVSASSDDAEERLSNGNMATSNNELQMIRRGTNDQAAGVRFRNLPIPQGATILSALVEFTIDTQISTATDLTIYGHKTDSAPRFGSANFNISGRTKTSAAVPWPSLPNLTVGAKLTTPDLTKIIQEIVNRAGWASGNSMAFIFTGTGTRTVIAFDKTPTLAPVLHVRYQTNATPTTPNNITVRQRLKDTVGTMKASGSTPIVDTLYEAGLYYRGQGVLYGLKRGPQTGATAQYTRVSIPASYTGGGGVYRAAGCTDTDLNAAACESEKIQGTPTYKSPFTAGCQANYIILLTDGDPTANNSVSLVQGQIGKRCAASPYGADARCSNELANYYRNTDLSGLAEDQKIVLHTIGFNSDGSPQYLKDLAAAGGGGFHTASTAAELEQAFADIVNKALTDPTSFVSPSLSVNAFNKLYNSDEVYFSLFTPDLPVAWAGNVKKYTLCNDTANSSCTYGEIIDKNGSAAISATTSKILSTAQSYWSAGTDGPVIKQGGAGENIPSNTERNVYTYTGSADVPTSPVDLTTSAHLVKQSAVSSTHDNPALTKAMLGDASMTEQQYYDIINWMRGKNVQGEAIPSGTTVPAGNRWAFADALHSRPVTVTYGYSASNVPVTKLVIGTNDGALRMINASDVSGSGGVEQWAVYIPDFLAAQATLTDNANGQHVSGLDGSPTVWIIDNNGDGKIDPSANPKDKAYLYVGERRGGRNIYAFDIAPDSLLSNPGSLTDIKPKYMWRIRGGSTGFEALGQTWSKPLHAKIRVKGANAGDSVLKDVLIFGGGYDPAQDDVMPVGGDSFGNAIYIVDPLNGSLLWSAGNTGSGAALQLSRMNYSIPADITAVDTDGDGAVDRLYAADTRGQIFRIDLGNQIDPAGSTAADRNGGSSGYVFADVGCTGGVRNDPADPAKSHCADTPKYERRKFFYAPDVAQVRDPTFSSVEDYDLMSIESGDREDPLDKITDSLSVGPMHNRIYAFRDMNIVTGAPASTPAALTDGNLYDATANDLQDPNGANYATALAAIRSRKGWYINLKDSTSSSWVGEKGLAKTSVFGGVLYATTYTPTTTVTTNGCNTAAEGTGTLYAMNYLNATAVTDLNGDANVDRSVTVGGGIPSEIVVVIRDGGVTALVGTSGGAKTPPINSKLPRYPTYWYDR